MVDLNVERNLKTVKNLDYITIYKGLESVVPYNASDIADFDLMVDDYNNVIGIMILFTSGSLMHHYGKNFDVVYKNQYTITPNEKKEE